MLVYNGKFGGGRMMINPMASLNDGYFELNFLKNLQGFGPITKMFDKCKNGGTQVYDSEMEVWRLSQLKLVNRSTQIDPTTKEKVFKP